MWCTFPPFFFSGFFAELWNTVYVCTNLVLCCFSHKTSTLWWTLVKKNLRRMPMFSLSAWVYIQKINMFSTAGSVVTGRIFVTSAIYFVLCDACFHRSTCSISLTFGGDFLRLLCMFSCFQNLYGLHDLSQSRTWLLDYCRMHFSSEDFCHLFWRNRQLCFREIFSALSYFTGGPLRMHFLFVPPEF